MNSETRKNHIEKVKAHLLMWKTEEDSSTATGRNHRDKIDQMLFVLDNSFGVSFGDDYIGLGGFGPSQFDR